LTDDRLQVRATLEFFADLDRQLGSDRGPHGEPSTNDFQVFELFAIVERLATGVLVRSCSVVGQLVSDGAVELVALELDLGSDGS
jgi:hypothetical protein